MFVLNQNVRDLLCHAVMYEHSIPFNMLSSVFTSTKEDM